MASGSWNGGGDVPAHPSAWCKANQGWVTTTVVTTNATITVPQVETSHQVFRLWKDGAAGTEYFLLENRQKTGYDAQMKGSGLLLWHVDESQPGNTDESHYKVALLQADGHRDLELNHNRSDAGDPFPGSSNVTVVNGTTTPNTKSYANADTCVALSAIAASSAAMSVHVQVSCKTILKDAIKDKKELVKETAKDRVKELAKDAKDATKDTKELKKEAVKELKEVAKDLKEIAKERVKDVVEKRPKELKEVKEVREGWDFDRPWERQLGAAGQPGVAGVQAGADELLAVIADLASRVAALESGEAAAPFIGEELRPDLAGAQPMADDTALRARLEAGDPGAKREFDGPVR